MGYTTEFRGRFELNKKLDADTMNFLKKFAETRHMKRYFPNNKHGVDGEFYVDGGGSFGQDHDDSVVDYNDPPSTQPSLWCQWVPSDDGMGIQWDGNEKFYAYEKWLLYIIKNFLAPKGYLLNGVVSWQGENPSDLGDLEVVDNVITISHRERYSRVTSSRRLS